MAARIESLVRPKPKACISQEEFARRVHYFTQTKDLQPLEQILTEKPLDVGYTHPIPFPFSEVKEMIKESSKKSVLTVGKLDEHDKCIFVCRVEGGQLLYLWLLFESGQENRLCLLVTICRLVISPRCLNPLTHISNKPSVD